LNFDKETVKSGALGKQMEEPAIDFALDRELETSIVNEVEEEKNKAKVEKKAGLLKDNLNESSDFDLDNY
jgi:hypothetical protein